MDNLNICFIRISLGWIFNLHGDKMIKLAFLTINKKVIKFTIDNRKIIYIDDLWKQGIQLMPMDAKVVRDLQFSGKENLKTMAKLIRDTNMGKELEEYQNCKTDEDIAMMVIKDAKSKGLLQIK